MKTIYLEDFPAGEIVEYGGVEVDGEAIVAFARDFDPQPFHIDAQAARAAFGSLIASGWHTSALLLRMNCDHFLRRAATRGEPGVEEINWLRPVRPGDVLRVRRKTLALRMDADQAVGEAEFAFEVLTQSNEIVMTQRSKILVERRAALDGARASHVL